MMRDFGVLSKPVLLCNGTDEDDKPMEITDGDGNVIGTGRTPREIDAYAMAQYQASVAIMEFLTGLVKDAGIIEEGE